MCLGKCIVTVLLHVQTPPGVGFKLVLFNKHNIIAFCLGKNGRLFTLSPYRCLCPSFVLKSGPVLHLLQDILSVDHHCNVEVADGYCGDLQAIISNIILSFMTVYMYVCIFHMADRLETEVMKPMDCYP